MTKRARAQDGQGGTVLLTVLAIVAVMSAVAVSVVDDIRFGVRQAANIELREQAFWFALGAEEFTKHVIWQDWQDEPARSTRQDAWARDGVRFPIDGGYISGAVYDGGNCFNLNSVVQTGDNDDLVVRDGGLEQFRSLLLALAFGPSDAERLGNVLVDWIDSDRATRPRGGEDDHYSRLTPPYRAANTHLADVSELRSLRGFDEDVYQTLRPYVCALPGNGPSRINVNTLTVDQAVLLVMLLGEDLGLRQAEEILRNRPPDGYSSEDAFWQQEGLASVQSSPEIRDQVQLNTTYYRLQGTVTYHDAYFAVASLFELLESGKVVLISRTWGEAD